MKTENNHLEEKTTAALQRRLETLAKEAEAKLRALKIPIHEVEEYSICKTKAWGHCRRTIRFHVETYSIRITRVLLEQASDEKVIQTLMHELLHTACFDDCHRGRFAMYAERVRQAFPQYQIARTNSAVELGVVRQ